MTAAAILDFIKVPFLHRGYRQISIKFGMQVQNDTLL